MSKYLASIIDIINHDVSVEKVRSEERKDHGSDDQSKRTVNNSFCHQKKHRLLCFFVLLLIIQGSICKNAAE